MGDKRARVEAGLDLEVGDLADTVLEQVVREVAAPAAKQELLDAWVASVSSLLASAPLPKTLHSALPAPPAPMAEGKFPGGRVASCAPAGALASRTLVFPGAHGRLLATLALPKPPPSPGALASSRQAALALVRARLQASGLAEGAVEYQLELFATTPSLVLRPAGKLARHVAVTLEVVVEGEGGSMAEVEEEARELLATHPSYRALVMALRVWARQVRRERLE